MAWEQVKCNNCGEKYRVQMYGKHRDREWKINNWNGICDSCKEKNKQLKIEEQKKESQKNAQIAKEKGMPELIGSEKQIQWAETLRMKRIEFIKLLIGKALQEDNKDYVKWLKMKFEKTITNSSAKFFIDLRNSDENSFKTAFNNYQLKQQAEKFLNQ